MGTVDVGREWRRRLVEVLEQHGGELRVDPERRQYGVSGILREQVGYTGNQRSWSALLRRCEREGVIVVLDRAEKRLWHVRLGDYADMLDADDLGEDEQVAPPWEDPLPPGSMPSGYIDYERLAYAVMAAATEAMAKPGRRMLRYKAQIRRLQADNVELTERLHKLDEEFDRYRRDWGPEAEPTIVDTDAWET